MTQTERQKTADLFRLIGPNAFGSSGEYQAFREAVEDYSPSEDAADKAEADKK